MTDKFNQDGSINENWLAEEITQREEGLKEIDIAQVKECLKVTLDILAELSNEGEEVDKMISVRVLKHAGRIGVDDLLEKHKESE